MDTTPNKGTEAGKSAEENKAVETSKATETAKGTEPSKTPETETNRVAEPFKVTGDWKVQSEKLKEKYAQLTDEDVKFETGKEDELLGRLGTRLNKKPEDIANIIKSLQAKA